jgi:hypothetical protein
MRRTKLTLWKIVREHIDEIWEKFKCKGLCVVVHGLYIYYDVISIQEKMDLIEEIESYDTKDGRLYFLGEYGDKEARIQFIEDRIEDYSNSTDQEIVKCTDVI